MICYECQGQRYVRVDGVLQPCAECGGTGELNCCEGLQAQPEPAQLDRAEQGPDHCQTPDR